MEISFRPDYLFDLTGFKYAALFDQAVYAWEAIPFISLFLKTLPLGNIEVNIPQGVHLVNPAQISIGKGTTVEPGAYIKGPCVIGENCSIRHGAYIRGDVITGDGCVIGHDTEVKNVLFLNHAHAAHFAYIGDSILGNHVNLGAGTKLANLKLNRQEVIVQGRHAKIRTGLRKFGALIGDGCQIGCNAVLNPGTILGKNVDCFPLVNLGGVVESNQVIKIQQNLSFTSKAQ